MKRSKAVGIVGVEGGWTLIESVSAIMVITLLIALISPILTTFNVADQAQQGRMQALGLAQEAMEQQLGTAPPEMRPVYGSETVRLDGQEYAVIWERRELDSNMDVVEVEVSWQIGEGRQRPVRLERAIWREAPHY